MTHSDAQTFNALLDRMLDLPSEQRSAFIDALGEAHAQHKPRLRALLARAGSSKLGVNHTLDTLPKLNAISLGITADTELSEGAVIGRYELLRRLGSGGMATVWLARDHQGLPEALVALKFARTARPGRALSERLARERQLLDALAHPNIAKLHGTAFTSAGRQYLVLQYIDGLPLDRYCAHHQLSLSRRFALFVQIADALTHAHERLIVHRDLKPSNVLVTEEGAVSLLDFGVAKLLDESPGQALPQLTSDAGAPVTPAYASPEQLGTGPVSFPADVYSLGAMLYELITGVRPYAPRSASPRTLRSAMFSSALALPSELAHTPELAACLAGGIDAMLLRALQLQPAQRYATMHEFAAEIEVHARTLSRLPRPVVVPTRPA